MSEKVYEVITDQIVKALEAGVVPWQKPWTATASMPRSANTGTAYRGINVWTLHFTGILKGYTSPLWITYKNAIKLGGKVTPGEKGVPVSFWKKLEIDDAQAPTGKKKIMMIRYYTVFNLEQTEGVKLPKKVADLVAPKRKRTKMAILKDAQKIADGYPNGPTIKHGSDRAAYTAQLDTILMPDQDTFVNTEEYFSTLFHEQTHSTGHSDRLARTGIVEHNGFGTANYTEEELVAEMGSAYLCGIAGVDQSKTFENSAAYLGHWLGVIKADPKFIVTVAGKAQKAADHILGRTWE